ncbi:ABC transporter substrate-binding protein [Ferrimonas kyonanensis]|uniref:ABC transporter substrate-binding protein n=1 Tax=Ferrimonas kyonanensis TaxID=364763 RepID=UPI00041CF2F9|nr:ABC transporter substrate-binding protein [Ferrimonas kyonanensis]
MLILSLLWLPLSAMAQRSPLKVVSLDYATTTTLIALGLPPVAIADVAGYRRWVLTPPLPGDIIDLGSANEPNLELLAQIRPDLILITPYQAQLTPLLSRIAPVHSFSIYQSTGDAIEKAETLTRNLGQLLNLQAQAQSLIDRSRDHLQAQRRRLQHAVASPPPLYLIRMHDDRHLWVYGKHSLGQAVIDRLGLSNAWQQPTNTWGFSAQSIEILSQPPQARILFLDPVPHGGVATLGQSPLWRHQRWFADNHYQVLPVVLMFGALPSAQRMATLLVDALLQEAP